MCVLDAAAKQAEVDGLLRRYPHLRGAAGGHGAQPGQRDAASVGDHTPTGHPGGTSLVHPALRGCEDVPWGDIPGCPADIPAVLHGLLDPAAAPDAARVLTNVLVAGLFHLGEAMPYALPFVLRLAVEPRALERARLLDLVLVAAELCRSVDPDNPREVLLLGHEADHPERARCRTVFREQAALVRALLDDPSVAREPADAEDRALLEEVAGGG
ncbi:hypothetical protein ABZZ79_28275 [Streptomyces sp. NPDC006458]|uniref:hypothetical protein n=1 Tax=Streptomyces sp. NPDC006458 TaxID=3154302 RepID=UPI0033AB6B30